MFCCLFGASRLSHLEAVLSSFRFKVVQKLSHFYCEFFEKFNLDRILFIFIHSLVMSFHIESGPPVILRALSCGKTKIKGNVTFTILHIHEEIDGFLILILKLVDATIQIFLRNRKFIKIDQRNTFSVRFLADSCKIPFKFII